MTYEFLSLETGGRVAVVRLNRPQSRNALSQSVMRELTHCARAIADQIDIDVVLLTGSERWFSAGADLKDEPSWEDQSLSLVARREVSSLGYRMCRAWEEMPQVTIACMEGYAIGGGLALALACDWRVLADDAFVSLPEIALGIPLTWGTIPRLTALLGPAQAKRLIILCERMPAAQALAIGLVDYVAPCSGTMDKAQEVAARVLQMPAAAVRMSKESVNAVAGALSHATAYSAHDQFALAAASAESRAARAAALQAGAKGT
jgi:enoyl-CoA hydratase/carnithine racemase